MKFFLACCRNSKQRCPRSGFSSFGFHSLTALPVAQHTNRWLDSVLLRPRILEYGTNLRRRGLFKALPCLQCPRVNASGVCETGESVCETQGSQRCFLRKVYEGSSHHLKYHPQRKTKEDIAGRGRQLPEKA
ncbi:acrosomal protein SP-10-like isoform X2 [Felis catus]|uniref:acrosomal protein SP-10-like isoform X2 n=1 Tax=Felis catus TaxID=9685 RepID=UPI001D1A321F|nr:acrosomal protein SP-10-like isoform X2 [Felis catus]